MSVCGFFFFFRSSFPDLTIGGLKPLEREEDEQNSQLVSLAIFVFSLVPVKAVRNACGFGWL